MVGQDQVKSVAQMLKRVSRRDAACDVDLQLPQLFFQNNPVRFQIIHHHNPPNIFQTKRRWGCFAFNLEVNVQAKARSDALFGFNPDIAPHHPHKALGDRKPKTTTFELAVLF